MVFAVEATDERFADHFGLKELEGKGKLRRKGASVEAVVHRHTDIFTLWIHRSQTSRPEKQRRPFDVSTAWETFALAITTWENM